MLAIDLGKMCRVFTIRKKHENTPTLEHQKSIKIWRAVQPTVRVPLLVS